MEKLKIPENYSGVSKTLRLPENIVENIQNLANIKNLSFNRVVIIWKIRKKINDFGDGEKNHRPQNHYLI